MKKTKLVTGKIKEGILYEVTITILGGSTIEVTEKKIRELK